jgi:hypothetical protein
VPRWALIAQNRRANRKLKEATCDKTTDNFLRTLWTDNPEGVLWNKAGDPEDWLRVIARCAGLLAALRAPINAWHSDDGSERLSQAVPVIEKPERIDCLLYNLARAHALVCGRRQLTADDLAPVLDVTFDSAPTLRARVFRGLVEAGGRLTTSDVVKLLRCSSPAARKEMEALAVPGVADKTSEDSVGRGRPEMETALASCSGWLLSEESQALHQVVTETQGGNLYRDTGPEMKKGFPPCVGHAPCRRNHQSRTKPRKPCCCEPLGPLPGGS